MLNQITSSDQIASYLLQEAKLPKASLDAYIIHKKSPNTPLRLQIQQRDEGIITKGAFSTSISRARVRVYRDIHHILLHTYLGTLDTNTLQQAITLVAKAKQTANQMPEEQKQTFCDNLTKLVASLVI